MAATKKLSSRAFMPSTAERVTVDEESEKQ